ncbi:MAG: class I SAM-dependent methyltransferase [Bacteroidetes bacterium]|nr:class I SAM-dependent methyltransferase [Bacteroidota bacterium]MBS1648723.1 class I SAM-dependent methyltransferase [Bacteroidota bacterium]
MYSPIKSVCKFLKYYFTASNSKGHGMHSPFVFDFIVNVLNDDRVFYAFAQIENIRKQLLKDNRTILIEDFGAGSKKNKTNERVVAAIAKSSLKPQKYSKLLFRIVHYYQSKTIIELGTSLGITTSYLASANENSKVITMEGSQAIAKIAEDNFAMLQLKNIEQVLGNFDATLPTVLTNINTVDFAFIDGNHQYQPTINYFEQLLLKSHEHSIIILDDIHWSKEMENAWRYVQQHKNVTATIDLFFIGIVLFRKDFKAKQHFNIRY